MKASRLKPGDSIGIVSPSWGGAGLYPHRVEQGRQYLQSLGFQVKIATYALNSSGFVSDTAENRAADIHAMFADPTVRAVVAAIGGDHSCHLLPYLDFDLIRRNPKIFIGYSDITVLNVAIWQKTGLVTFNGPAFLTDFAEYPRMLDYTERYFLRVLTQDQPAGIVPPSDYWTEEYLAWEGKKDQERARRLNASPGWTWLKPGYGEGRLIGGCIESLQHLRGTQFWPDWDDAILFFETSEDKPSPATVDGILMDYQNMGVLGKLRGLLVGRPMGYSEVEKTVLRKCILDRMSGYDFPIITDMDFGHTSPQMTLPIGCRAAVDTQAHCFILLEAGCIDSPG
jgi:muramoyltetrapeptide carboxypeptidase LdcA involved in peptidoglycan recycling